MYRAPVNSQRSPGAPRPARRFPSPASCWSLPGQRGGSPRGSPLCSPPPHRAHRDGSPADFGSGSRWFGDSPAGFGSGSRGFGDSPAGFGSGSRGFGDSPAGFGSGSRGFRGPSRRRSSGFRRPPSFSPASAHSFQGGSSDSSVEKYFSPSMLQDPWAALQPVTDPHTNRQQHNNKQ